MDGPTLYLTTLDPAADRESRCSWMDRRWPVFTTKMSRSSSGAADGRVVVGKLFSVGKHYASVEIDELIFFNQTLNLDQIKELNENSFP